jgi:glycosyltransferase involved in cell wall biosynthesis
LTKSLRELDVQVLYANTLQSYYSIDVAKSIGLPIVWNVRESEDWRSYFDFLSPKVRECVHRNFQYPYRVVFVSHATRQRYKDLDVRHNFTVIHNGLSPERIQRAKTTYSRTEARRRLGLTSDSELVFLLLGTVCERKGQHDLVEATMQLSRKYWKHVQFYIVGDRPGPYSSDLHALVSMLPEWAQQRMVIVPETDNTSLYYRAADIFVCTSRVESYPRVTMEAMAYGLPIITAPVFGIVEQVRDGVNALFYPPGDPGALATAIQHLIENPQDRRRLAENSSDVLHSLPSFSEMCRLYATNFREASVASSPGD